MVHDDDAGIAADVDDNDVVDVKIWTGDHNLAINSNNEDAVNI